MAGNVHTEILGGRGTSSDVGLARLGFAAMLLAVALALVGGARADKTPPALTLGTVSVTDGTAVVTGSVDVDANTGGVLEINGQPVQVDASGAFSAVVDLGGEAALVLTLDNGPGETTVTTIPLVALGSGGDGILDELNLAGISIDVPPDGFQIVDGNMPVVSGRVLDGDKLASLTVDGVDVLELVGPGGLFSIQLPGSGSQREVIVNATDHRGISQTTIFRLTAVSTVVKTHAGASVSAAGARGIVIARILLDKRHLRAKKQLGLVVTVKDRRGFLIRGAAVRLKGAPSRYFANGANRANFTNRLGKARFTYRFLRGVFTGQTRKHVAVVVRASTPTAAAAKTVRLRLPKLAHR